MLIEPVYSRITGAWTTVIARKVTGPNGEFLGVIGRGIEPVNFEKFFATVALGTGAAIAMHHRDGTLLARYPHVDDMIGKNFKTGPASQRQMFELPSSTSRLTSPIDGEDRLILLARADEFSDRNRRGNDDIRRAGRLARADRNADRDRQPFGAGDSRTAVSRRPQAFASAPRVEAAVDAGKTAARHRRQQHDARAAAVQCPATLVICNKRYIEMYGLSAEILKPGCSFRDVIAHRKETGSFVGDIDHYIEEVLDDITRRNAMVISTPDGR